MVHASECSLDKVIDLLSGNWRQVTGRSIFVEHKLGPDHNMCYLWVNTVWPVIVQDAYVF